MRRLRWRSQPGDGGAGTGTLDGSLPPADGDGTDWVPPAGPAQVPGWLQLAGGWAWRLLVVGLVIYLAFRVASALRLVVLPSVAALLLTALLRPLTSRLRRAGLPALAATWCTVLVVVAVLAGAGVLVAT